MKKTFLLFIVLITLFSFGTSCNDSKEQAENNSLGNVEKNKIDLKTPKNIILLIGDGMGLSQVSASLYFNENTPNFEQFSTIGLIKTSASNSLITDSAAGATAFASGVKTYNGAVGVDKDSVSVKTIIELISEKNMATGVISTSSITHATPACFYAHATSRRLAEDIAAFLPASEVDFFAGGGLQFFNNRTDGKDLIAILKENGFDVSTTSLPETLSEKKQAILLADNAMPTMLENRGNFLPDATKLALESLSKNEDGFFLMVEGSQIDWGGHANDSEYLITELLDFDKTLGVALDFAREHGDTLIIVTADHETGGFTLASDGDDYNKIKPVFSTDGHSGTMVPVFAEGPGAYLFSGIYENTEIFHKMMQLFSE